MGGLTWLLIVCAVLILWPGPSSARSLSKDSPEGALTAGQALAGLPLATGWKFHRGDNPSWASPVFDDSAWQRVTFPHRWYPRAGAGEGSRFGWYRLHLQFESGLPQIRNELARLGLRLGSVLSAYEVYAGGMPIGGVGVLPPAGDTAVDYERQRILAIPPEAIDSQGRLVLALRVWGGSDAMVANWGMGAYAGEFKLGRFSTLLMSLVRAEMPGLMVSVIGIVFGLYHLYLYSRNRHLESFLWFGFTAMAVGVYGLLLNEWRYYLDWEFLTFKKLEFATAYLVPALSLQLVWSLVDEPMGRWLRAYQLSFVAVGLLLVAIPGLDIHAATLSYWQLWTLPAQLLAAWMLVRKMRQGHDEARTIVLGGLLFIATCIHDVFGDFLRMQSSRLIPWGFLAFMLAMAVSLGNRFTAMLNGLEEEVAERTAELQSTNRLLVETARVDPLTGLYNRRGFTGTVESEIQRVFRSGRSFCVVLTDVDHFKSINDRYGHACGDHVLTRVASKLRDNVRDVDQVARWGGEEFILLLPETEPEGAAVLAEKLRAVVADNVFEFGGHRLRVTMTFGVSGFRKGESLDSCIARADRALYRGKDEGRNRVMLGSQQSLTLAT